jgi:hypothetical protein
MIPILLVSEEKGKIAKILYYSSTSAGFLSTIVFWSLELITIFKVSANFTNDTSSGDEA